MEKRPHKCMARKPLFLLWNGLSETEPPKGHLGVHALHQSVRCASHCLTICEECAIASVNNYKSSRELYKYYKWLIPCLLTLAPRALRFRWRTRQAYMIMESWTLHTRNGMHESGETWSRGPWNRGHVNPQYLLSRIKLHDHLSIEVFGSN